MNDITRPIPKNPKPNQQENEAAASQAPPDGVASMPTPNDVVVEPSVAQDKPLLIAAPKKRVWLRWLLGVAVFLVLALVFASVSAYVWYQDALKPVSTEMNNTNFVVAEGSSVEKIANELAQKGLVKNSLATQIYMRLNDKTNIKAGNYVLSPNQSVAEITNWLNEGRTDTLRVTILPGRTLKDLKTDLAQYGFAAEDIDAALTKEWDHPLLADKPKDASIEGYIYPETYFMGATATPEDVIKHSFDIFQQRIESAGLKEKLSERGFNLHQGITLASIINAEVSGAEDMRIVSQVFQTRLKDGMVLGSDPTYIYGAELLGVQPSPSLESPYNTRKEPGLPPTPIGNFNLPALEAVVNPANTTYLFFVAGDDGVTHYSYTFAEHEANIAKYCKRACAAN